jgi:hypothetical protein
MMNKLPMLLRVLMALSLVTCALPSFAGGFDPDWWKEYSLNMAIGSAPPAQAPFTVTAKITNRGLLPVGSFTLTSSGLTIVGVFPPGNGGKVTGPFPGPSVSITRMFPLFFAESLTLKLQVSSCGDGDWSAVVWPGAFLNGPPLELDADASTLETSITCASVASGAPFVVPDTTSVSGCVTLQGGSIAGERGFYDKSGLPPAGTLPIFVTNMILTDDQMHFRWPDFETGGDPLATFEYTVCASGPLPQNTLVAWLNADGTPASTPGTPVYISAEDCLANDNVPATPYFLPAPYGTLTTSIGSTGGIPYNTNFNGTLELLPINTSAPAPVPAGAVPGSVAGSVPYPGKAPTSPDNPGTQFDVVIGTERITVQQVCLDNDNDPTDTDDCDEYDEGEGEALMVVQRGVGGTIAAAHDASVLIMSTPLPLLPVGAGAPPPPYTAGNQALMCIATQTGETSPPAPQVGVHTTTFMDIGGDGWANHP